MGKSQLHKPKLAVIGVGDYYRMILSGIQNEFEIVVAVDKDDYDHESGGLEAHVRSFSPECVMILTPNRFHAEHIEEVSGLGVPVYVEKPLVTSQCDLNRVSESLKRNPALFCSDFYVDVWDAPLLKWMGKPIPACLEQHLLINPLRWEAWRAGLAPIGEIVSVEATLLEGIGPASSFAGREWLWDAFHGGVLWDMGYHELALWFAIIGEPLSVLSVSRSTIASAPLGASETYGEVHMRSSSGIPFTFRVGKYIETGDDRAFRIKGTTGEVSMEFGYPSGLYFNGDPVPLAQLTGPALEYSPAVFREYVRGNPQNPFGFELAVKCVDTMLEIRTKGDF